MRKPDFITACSLSQLKIFFQRRKEWSELKEGGINTGKEEKNYGQLKSNYEATPATLATKTDNKSSLRALTVVVLTTIIGTNWKPAGHFNFSQRVWKCECA